MLFAEEPEKPSTSTNEPVAPTPPSPEGEAAKSAGLKPGQGTAIVTGAISLILGVAYIALTIALDSRGGGSLQPPPPEAFM